MNGEQTMEDKIEYKSKTGHFWIGLRNGSDFPLNRNVYAMARSQEYRPGLRNGSIFTEFFVAKNPEIVRCSCHSMESVVKKLHSRHVIYVQAGKVRRDRLHGTGMQRRPIRQRRPAEQG